MNARDLDEALEMGMDWSLREGYVWPEDKEHCEEYGRMLNANPACVSTRAKKRGLPQLGTLGAGNHYAEIQVNLLSYPGCHRGCQKRLIFYRKIHFNDSNYCRL